MEFKHKFNIKDYLVNDITEAKYESVDDISVDIEVTFELEAVGDGVVLRVKSVDSLSLTYNGFLPDKEEPESVELLVDTTQWRIFHVSSFNPDVNVQCGMFINTISVDVDKKEVNVEFEF